MCVCVFVCGWTSPGAEERANTHTYGHVFLPKLISCPDVWDEEDLNVCSGFEVDCSAPLTHRPNKNHRQQSRAKQSLQSNLAGVFFFLQPISRPRPTQTNSILMEHLERPEWSNYPRRGECVCACGRTKTRRCHTSTQRLKDKY